jgi:thymidylate synthase (FAD)
MGGDSSVVQAARVSIVGENTPEESETDGLINYLMKHRHGSPFEHTAMTFYVKAPIYVLREFQRHRAGFSYNEMSGRYTELLPEFFVPPTTRGIKNVGTSARPVMELGDFEVTARGILQLSFEKSWEEYQRLLRHGVAREVARAVLPVGIMSQMYVTCNARSLMHFLSLRTSNADAVQRSYPQYEIEQVALLLESALEQHFPRVYAAFVASGRVAP